MSSTIDGSDSDDDGLPSDGCHRHGTLSRGTAIETVGVSQAYVGALKHELSKL
jgi:hypothetical protein